MEKQDSRRYSRVNTYLPLEARLIPSEETDNLIAHVSKVGIVIDEVTPHELEDKVLGEWLKMLNDKMDSILEMLSSERQDTSHITLEPLNISAGGMRIRSPRSYDIGSVMEIKIVLPMRPYKILYLYGKVVRVEDTPNFFNVAVKFIGMNDEVEEELLRFDFKKHREMLTMRNCLEL